MWVQSAATQQVKTQAIQTEEDEDGWSAWNLTAVRQEKTAGLGGQEIQGDAEVMFCCGPKSDSPNTVSSVRGREWWAGTFGIPVHEKTQANCPALLTQLLQEPDSSRKKGKGMELS